MKRGFKLMLMLLLITVAASAQLTYRGNSEMPADIVLVEFADYQPGDQVFSAYTYDSALYASWVQPAAAKKFFIRAMFNDGDKAVKTGIESNEIPQYILLRDKQYTLLTVETGKSTGYYKEGYITATKTNVVLHDNLYYSLCPEWPVKTTTLARTTPTTDQYLYFYSFLNFNEVLPKYTTEIKFEIITGSGRLIPPAKSSNQPNMWRYQFRAADIGRGYIELLVKVQGFKNCNQDNHLRIITVKL